MANVAPAKLAITSSTGPGQAVTSQVFTDVMDFEVDFRANTIRVLRAGASGLQYFDYSAIATVTWTISGGLSTLSFT